jgi:hypothetical protein
MTSSSSSTTTIPSNSQSKGNKSNSVHSEHVVDSATAVVASAAPLFDDSYTTLTADGVVIHTYYFPIGTAKRFSWHDVEELQVSDNAGLFASKSWGSPDLVHWFGCHMWREFNGELKKIVAFKLRGSSILPSVTPLRADEFIRICRQQLALARKTAPPPATTPK